MTRLFLDWGSTNLRVHRVEDGKLVETRCSNDGAAGCHTTAEFEAVFDRATDGWCGKADSVVLSGMVTRKGGWVETPYLSVPIDLSTLQDNASIRDLGPTRLSFLPGLSQSRPPDVIRGEESMLLGLAKPGVSQLIILPGTHSKWVMMDGSVVLSFRTFMTGEVFGLALRHSLAGQLADGDEHDEAAFADGVTMARTNTLLASIFQARSRVLVSKSDARGTASFLSGLFVATEILEADRLTPDIRKPPVIVGAEKLIAAYLLAFRLLGKEVCPAGEGATRRGVELLSVTT